MLGEIGRGSGANQTGNQIKKGSVLLGNVLGIATLLLFLG